MRPIGFQYKTPMKSRKPKVQFELNADDVFAAACQAFRINGAYVKVLDSDKPTLKTNRMIVDDLLNNVSKITAADREQGEQMRRYFKGFAFKLLEGKTLNEFNNAAMTIANKDMITTAFDLAVVVSLPSTYMRSTQRDEVERRLKWANGGHIGAVGDSVSLEIEVVKQLWSQNWNTWYITGVTKEENVVFFAFKRQMNIGDRIQIKGTVKRHDVSSTQLNRVKILS